MSKNPKDSEKPAPINKWDSSAVKNAVDDAVKEAILVKPNCYESYTLFDGRLAMCTLAVGVAGFAVLWDWLHPFPESKLVLKICVGSYFILMGLLTLYTKYIEKGIFAILKQKDSSDSVNIVWELRSNMEKYDDIYTLTVICKNLKSGDQKETSISQSIANFVDEDGLVVESIVESKMKKLCNSLMSEKNK